MKFKKYTVCKGVEIGDKHVEVMVRQMLRKVRVIDAGETDVLPGTLLDIHQFTDANEKALLKVNCQQQDALYYLVLQKHLLKQIPSYPQLHSKKQHVFLRMLQLKENVMNYLGLKENVIIGKLIPAGTGMSRYRKAEPVVKTTEEEDPVH